ncbi:MAG: DEAD/DEAH box helicase family protein, partial [Granulosicoccus sp.]
MSDSIDTLRRENQRLIALLDRHGINWRESDEPETTATDTPPTSLSTDEKVRLFQSLFKGRTDVYAQRWESRTRNQSGYSPACANEWRAGICEKPRIKCSQCTHRRLIPLSEQIIYDHLAGTLTAGIYPLLDDNTCHFLAVDFDKADWQNDIKAFAASCDEFNVPVALEISRSGQGAHAWIFFDQAIPARDARQLGTVLISHTCAQRHQLDLSSYDRLFPNQDLLPKGGFGNLIALPLQKAPRSHGHSVFVDRKLNVIDDQWAHLAAIARFSPAGVLATIQSAAGDSHPLDVAFIDDEDLKTPWKRTQHTPLQPEDIPETLSLRLVDKLYIEKDALTPRLLHRLVRLAAFQNPEFYKAQKMRLPVWGKPRIIGCADNYPHHIALPRGCLEPVLALLETLNIQLALIDEREPGTPISTRFTGTLHPEQTRAVNAMLAHDTGILSAPTAFGKTVAAAAIIAQRKTSTLILVHRSQLQAQWHERLSAFLELPTQSIGVFGGGRKKLTGRIDIALLQSLSRQGNVNALVEQYGHVVIDECHH